MLYGLQEQRVSELEIQMLGMIWELELVQLTLMHVGSVRLVPKYDLKPYCVGAGLLTSMGYYFSDTYETTIEAFNDNNDYNTVIDAWIDFGKSEKFIDEHFTMNQLERLVNFVA